MELTDRIKQKGLELGFTHVGVTTAEDFWDYEAELLRRPDYEMWATTDRAKYPGRSYLRMAAHPKTYYPEGKSIICATFGYSQYAYPQELTPYVARAYLCRAYVPQARSAAGVRVREFKDYLRDEGVGVYEGDFELPERLACARAGIITYGKNNFAYTEEDGSFNILYSFLVDTELRYDTPTVRCDCPESCRRCIDACPTQAILGPGRLHLQNCAIHNNQLPLGAVPRELWEKLGTHLHGCDECQLACPRNQAVLKKAVRKDMLLEKLKETFDLDRILLLDESYYEETVKPIMYNYIRDMDLFRRNAAIAIGNSGDPAHLPALRQALTCGNEELREVVEWAIERLSA